MGIIELQQILHLKVGCSDFGPVGDSSRRPLTLHMENGLLS